ncbi:hypothetical protein [Burkholderia cenocepacia]|uniref:hypothetical protein n=1 Tax=Burkholderia cenocepacia TaxID=95486 RepID=UPI000F592E9E|nr:hypothetical protein [Burkholderia cenocepacia]
MYTHVPKQATQNHSSHKYNSEVAEERAPKKGFIFSPFTTGDMYAMAVGLNMSRVLNKKSALPLISSSEDEFQGLTKLKSEFSSDPNYEYWVSLGAKVFEMMKIGTGELRESGVPKIDGESERDTVRALGVFLAHKRTRVFKWHGAKLAALKPNTTKVYLIGHGLPGENLLADCSDGDYRSITSAQVAAKISASGIAKDISDFRVSSCWSADVKKLFSFQALKDYSVAQIEEKPFGQHFANALESQGFSQARVTGYHGAGLRFTDDSNMKNMRVITMNGRVVERARSSSVRRVFRPES